MDYCLFLKVASTGNNIDGGHECPVQFACKLLHAEPDFTMNSCFRSIAYSFTQTVMPDEPILDVSAAYCGLSSKFLEKDKAPSFLDEAPRWSRIVSKFANKNIYLAGWDLLEDDLRVLESNMKRLSIDFPSIDKLKVIDVKKLAERTLPIKELGKVGLDIVTYNLSKHLALEYGILNSYKSSRWNKTFCEKSLSQAAYCMFKLAEKAGLASFDAVYSFLQKPRLLEVFPFGKYRGKKLSEVFQKDHDYLCWLHSCKDIMDKNADLKYTLDEMMSV